MEIKLLDCTLRDGGYYNNWEFSRDLIKEYLVAMHAANVDIVEIGFRTFESNVNRGPCAYSTDDFIQKLDIPNDIEIGVMVNASDLINHDQGPDESAKLLFLPKHKSPVNLVRLACHFHEYEQMLTVCDWLHDIGYKVGINLMQVDKCSNQELKAAAKIINNHSIDVLYFADSFGSLDSGRTEEIIKSFKENWAGPIGIHTHDNMGRALSNTLTAINEGVTWIDSTVTGMGRGPGNVQTEFVLIELSKITDRIHHLSPVLRLIREYFQPLKDKYSWGKNPYYYIAGQEGIHPTYIQEMINDPNYMESEILSTMSHLAEIGGRKFSKDALNSGLSSNNENSSGLWDPSKILKDRELLIIGSGPGAKLHQKIIEKYIENNNPFVIALNRENSISDSLIDLRAACHPFSLMMDAKEYKNYNQPLVVPVGRLSNELRESLGEKELYDFGMQIKSGIFEFSSTAAVVPSPLVLSYVLAIATSGEVKKIMLAGFDGYEKHDTRTKDLNDLFNLYQSTKKSISLIAVTPTQYKIHFSSIEEM